VTAPVTTPHPITRAWLRTGRAPDAVGYRHQTIPRMATARAADARHHAQGAPSVNTATLVK
jgi:hypothetical protein